jgi:hypothetical protein
MLLLSSLERFLKTLRYPGVGAFGVLACVAAGSKMKTGFLLENPYAVSNSTMALTKLHWSLGFNVTTFVGSGINHDRTVRRDFDPRRWAA